MLGTYSYNEIFRKTVIAFGTLFNNIEINKNLNPPWQLLSDHFILLLDEQ